VVYPGVTAPVALHSLKMPVSRGQRFSFANLIMHTALLAPPTKKLWLVAGNSARRKSCTAMSMVRFKSSLARNAEALQGFDELLKAGSEALQVLLYMYAYIHIYIYIYVQINIHICMYMYHFDM